MNAITHTGEGGSAQGPTGHSRREAIASIGALALAAITVASDAVRATQLDPVGSLTHPDRELLTLGDAMNQSWDAEKAHEIATEGDFSQEACDRHEAICEITSLIVHRISRLEAVTIEGLVVKARAISWCHCGVLVSAITFAGGNHPTSDLMLAASITHDLLRMSEAQDA